MHYDADLLRDPGEQVKGVEVPGEGQYLSPEHGAQTASVGSLENVPAKQALHYVDVARDPAEQVRGAVIPVDGQ